MGEVNYQLKLPEQMKIHSVFHISLLELTTVRTPIQENLMLIETDKKYEVEQIEGMQNYKGKHQYLIK
jgi:hypothetical protein